jgi:shikimate kinase
MKNIYLVGFMGTGKTAVGRSLARRLGLDFVDLDSKIEQEQGKKIKDIFAKQGEAYFRNLEKAAVREVSAKEGLIVACGGGVVLDKENLEILKNTGSVICLTSRPEIILSRCKNNVERPLLNVKDPKKQIESLLEFRRPYYAKAQFSLDTSDLTIEQAADEIIKQLKTQ